MRLTLLSITNAYGMIVNGGKKITPTLIDRVQDRRGNTIFRHDERDCKNCNGINLCLIPLLATKDTREKIIHLLLHIRWYQCYKVQ